MFAKRLAAAAGTVAGFAGHILAGTLLTSSRVHADDDRNSQLHRQCRERVQWLP